jgi:hypothetical protein
MDKESLLRSSNAHGTDHVVIGATAFPIHGYARATLDIDIFIRPERDNATRTLEALRAFGYDVTDLTVDDLLTHKILIRQYVVELDVHPFVRSVDFAQVWRNRVTGTFGAVPVAYASLDDLITMKRAAGRPKDLEDLRALEQLRARRV